MANYVSFTYGRKGSGKSLDEAVNGFAQFARYYKSERKGLPPRIYFSKQKFSALVESWELIGYAPDGIPRPGGHLAYWNHVSELEFCPRPRLFGTCWKGDAPHQLHHCDVAWDEIGNDLPPDGWKDNPPWLRQLFSHCRKRKNKIFCNTQRYDMVDIHVRRQVDIVFEVRRFIGSDDDPLKPPVKFPFLVQARYAIHPDDIKKDAVDEAPTTGIPRLKFYGRKSMSLFDTTFELPPYVATRMREVVLECIEGDNCRDPKHRHQVRHVVA